MTLAVAVGLVVCGGTAGAEEEKGKCPKAKAALTGSDGLPSDFPTPSAVVYTKTKSAGPSVITTGYVNGSLSNAYSSWKKALGKAPYAVTKSEKEEDDAEVNFASKNESGQVKLQVPCEGRVSVVVTARPA